MEKTVYRVWWDYGDEYDIGIIVYNGIMVTSMEEWERKVKEYVEKEKDWYMKKYIRSTNYDAFEGTFEEWVEWCIEYYSYSTEIDLNKIDNYEDYEN